MIDKNYSIESIIRYITTGLGIISESVSVKEYDGIIINVDAGMLIKCVSSYFNLDNFYPEVKDLKLDKALYDSLRNDLGIKEKSITFEVGSYEYENISPCLNFDIYDISFYKRVLNLLKKKLKNFGK
ncbi:MAG: hypothetical protein PUH53_06345 [Mycoplasma sp.]|nr:hypothetical protein [Mycoplasma sp.]MDY4619047.1 hypothetical protein [Bacilli bacterium]